MRTLKILVGFGALLLVASNANAAVSFTVSTHAPDADQAQEIDLTLTLSGGDGGPVLAYQVDWLLNGAAIPLSAVELPAGGAPSGPVVTTAANCAAGTANQFICGFGAATATGSQGSNDQGTAWLWDSPGSLADGVYNLGRFTFTAGAIGDVSIGNCLILTSTGSLPCQSNSAALIPEPTTAALLGLGLFGLALGGRRIGDRRN